MRYRRLVLLTLLVLCAGVLLCVVNVRAMNCPCGWSCSKLLFLNRESFALQLHRRGLPFRYQGSGLVRREYDIGSDCTFMFYVLDKDWQIVWVQTSEGESVDLALPGNSAGLIVLVVAIFVIVLGWLFELWRVCYGRITGR